MTIATDFQIDSAPLQGFTDYIYRNAHAATFSGITNYYTPFVRIEHSGFRAKELRELMMATQGNAFTIPQVLPGSGEEMNRFVALLKENGLQRCDLNFGCPFPMITKRQRGSGILLHPEKIEEIVAVMKASPEIDFSVKMRLGWDNLEQGRRSIQILNRLPLQHITLHARFGVDQYKGEVSHEAFGELLSETEHRVLYNGDLKSVEDIERIRNRYPTLAGVALGRGMLTSPWLAESYGTLLSNEECIARFKEFYHLLLSSYADHLQGDHQLLMKMQSFWEYFFPNADRKLLKAIKKAGSLNNYNVAVNRLFGSLK